MKTEYEQLVILVETSAKHGHCQLPTATALLLPDCLSN